MICCNTKILEACVASIPNLVDLSGTILNHLYELLKDFYNQLNVINVARGIGPACLV